MPNALTDAIDIFLLQLGKIKTKDKVSWNKGGELYSLVFEDGHKKSLFATYLKEDQLHLKNIFTEIFDKSKNDKITYVQCEKIRIEEVVKDGKIIGNYIFIVMENIVPLISVVLDEKYVAPCANSNIKKEKLLLSVIQAGKCISVINREFSHINLFINNEEICINHEGLSKILLFDMIKNQISTNNQVYELNNFMERIAKGLGVSINIKINSRHMQDFVNECIKQREDILEREDNYKTKLKENIDAAKRNDPKAFTNLGYMYERGKGTEINYQKALFWYKKGAEKNYAPAINNLAHMYQKGYGVEKDHIKAVNYLRQAAKLKDSVAWFNLGIAYQKGKGVEKDLKEALNCYKKSAKYGNNTGKIMHEHLKNKI